MVLLVKWHNPEAKVVNGLLSLAKINSFELYIQSINLNTVCPLVNLFSKGQILNYCEACNVYG